MRVLAKDELVNKIESLTFGDAVIDGVELLSDNDAKQLRKFTETQLFLIIGLMEVSKKTWTNAAKDK